MPRVKFIFSSFLFFYLYFLQARDREPRVIFIAFRSKKWKQCGKPPASVSALGCEWHASAQHGHEPLTIRYHISLKLQDAGGRTPCDRRLTLTIGT